MPPGSIMPTSVTYTGQPSAKTGQVARLVSEMMQRREYTSFWMITSISERLGLGRLAKGLRDIRFRGGSTEAIVTTVAGGSGAERLQEAIKLIDRPYAIVDPQPHLTGTFFYVAQGRSSATVVFGPSGFAAESEPDVHESALLMELDMGDAPDRSLLEGLRAQFDALLELPDYCRPLTADLVPDLVAAADKPLEAPTLRRATGESSGIPGFFKRLSDNDASDHDSPGQIIIPQKFISFFDELNIKRDRSPGGGPRQRHREFELTFLDGDERIEVDSARVVLYVPAADHPRKNPEMRFTFRSRGILSRLDGGDYLTFTRNDRGRIVVERHDPDWVAPGEEPGKRYGVLDD